MKAAVLYEPKTPYRIVDLEQDPPKEGEVRVKVDVAGVCLSDYHFQAGEAVIPFPAVLGHEGSGTVIEVGPGVTRVKPGDRCILAFVSICGQCRPCVTGFQNLCDMHVKTGPRQLDGTVRLHDEQGHEVFQMGKLGVFAETIVCPQQACQPIPDSVSMEAAALIGCSVTTGVGAVINSPAARAGMTVAVFGCGGVGLNCIQGARVAGASRIIAVDVRDNKLEFAYRFGATDVINSREVDDVGTAIKDLTGGGVDMAFDAYGSPEVTASAVKALRKTGTAVIVGLAPVWDRAPIDMVDMVRNMKTVTGSYYGSGSPYENFRRMLDLHQKGLIEVDQLVLRRYSLDQINEGFDELLQGGDGRGVIVF